MPVSLRSSQARQPISIEVRNVAKAEEDISDSNLNTEATPSNRSLISSDDHDVDGESILFYRSVISDDNPSELSMSPKLPVSKAQYSLELEAAQIRLADVTTPLPIDFQELDLYLKRDRNDLTLDLTRTKSYSISVANVINEYEMLLLFVTSIIDYAATNESSRYSIACDRVWTSEISRLLGQPQPDLTYGLLPGPLKTDYGSVFEVHGRFFQYLQPLKGVVLPVLTFELKGPKGNLVEACLQSQNNSACAIRNLVNIKRAAGRKPKSYVGRVLSLSVEMTTTIVQVHYHWITVTSKGVDQYWSAQLQPSVNVCDLPEVQKLIRNVFDWTRDQLESLIEDLVLLEREIDASLTTSRSTRNTRDRKRARSSSEEIEPAVKRSGKKKRVV